VCQQRRRRLPVVTARRAKRVSTRAACVQRLATDSARHAAACPFAAQDSTEVAVEEFRREAAKHVALALLVFTAVDALERLQGLALRVRIAHKTIILMGHALPI
jgi:hypothetical protein